MVYNDKKDFAEGKKMKNAVVFYSMSGNTKSIAQRISEQTGADLIELKPKKAYPDKGIKKFLWGGKSAVMGEKPELEAYDFNAELYDGIIFGFPVWASSFTPPIRTFIEENPSVKQKKISAFACMSGSGANKAFEKLKAALGVTSFENELILIDPKDKPSEENEKAIEQFISSLG